MGTGSDTLSLVRGYEVKKLGLISCIGLLGLLEGCSGPDAQDVWPDQCPKGWMFNASGVCVPENAPVMCKSDEYLSDDFKTCKPKPLTEKACEAKHQVLSEDGKTCVDAPKPDPTSCAAEGKVPSPDGRSCVEAQIPAPTQESCAAQGKVLSPDGKGCVEAQLPAPTPESCAAQGLMLSADGKECVVIPPAETAVSCAANDQVVVAKACVDPTTVEYAFVGKLDELALGFGADTAADLFDACMASTELWKSATVTQFGSSISDSYKDIKAPWTAEQVCAAAVLNSTSKEYVQPLVSAVVDPGLPVTLVSRFVNDMDADLTTYLPKLAVPEAQGVYLENKLYRPTNALLWTSEDILSILRYSMLRDDGSLVASGMINGAPFVFTGNDYQEVFNQCYDYLNHSSAFTRNINSVFVNGKNELWAPRAEIDKACTAIAYDAVPFDG